MTRVVPADYQQVMETISSERNHGLGNETTLPGHLRLPKAIHTDRLGMPGAQ